MKVGNKSIFLNELLSEVDGHRFKIGKLDIVAVETTSGNKILWQVKRRSGDGLGRGKAEEVANEQIRTWKE